jgi:thiol-disulfide isomerase/thioredoxin
MNGNQRNRAWGYLGSGVLIWLGMIALVFVIIQLFFDDHSQAAPVVGARSPDFELVSLDGEHVSLSEKQGKPLLLNFWATWCTPCVVEMPNIEKYYQLYPGEFTVLAINADEPELAVQRFAQEMDLSFEVLLDPGGKIQSLYRISGYPTSFFVDAEGVIRAQHIGSLTEDQLEGYLVQVGVGQ